MTQQNQEEQFISILQELRKELREGLKELNDKVDILTHESIERDKKIISMEEGLQAEGKNILIDEEVRVADSRHSELEISHVDRKVEAEDCTTNASLATEEDAVAVIEELFAKLISFFGHTSELDHISAVSVADRPLLHDESEFESDVAESDSRFDVSAFHIKPGALAEVPIETGIDEATFVFDTIEPRNEIEPEPGIWLSKEDTNAPFLRTAVNSGEVRNATQGDFEEPRISSLPARNYRLLKIWQTRTRQIPGALTASKEDLICRFKCKTCWCKADEYTCVRFWDPGEY